MLWTLRVRHVLIATVPETDQNSRHGYILQWLLGFWTACMISSEVRCQGLQEPVEPDAQKPKNTFLINLHIWLSTTIWNMLCPLINITIWIPYNVLIARSHLALLFCITRTWTYADLCHLLSNKIQRMMFWILR